MDQKPLDFKGVTAENYGGLIDHFNKRLNQLKIRRHRLNVSLERLLNQDQRIRKQVEEIEAWLKQINKTVSENPNSLLTPELLARKSQIELKLQTLRRRQAAIPMHTSLVLEMKIHAEEKAMAVIESSLAETWAFIREKGWAE